MNIKRVAYETKPFEMPRDDMAWKASVHHHNQDKSAPYMKALSSDVSRKGNSSKPQTTTEKSAGSPVADAASYGESGMSATEVERVIDEFLKTRN